MNATFPKNDAEQEWSVCVDLAKLGSEYMSAGDAEKVAEYIGQAVNEAAREAYKQWLI